MAANPNPNLPLSSPGGSGRGGKSKPLMPSKKGGGSNTPPPSKPGEPVPLAPKSFQNSKNKKGNGRKIVAIVFGSLIVLLLIGAIGFVVFRLFIGNGDKNGQATQETQGNQPVATGSENTTDKPVDLGAWTTEPACLDLEMQGVWIQDTDEDGLTNAEERLFGTNPCKQDTSGDGVMDGEAIENDQNPLGPGPLDHAKYGLPNPESN